MLTNRLDRLEEAGVILRLADPNDRRGVLVEPTEAGHAAWERTIHTQAAREALIATVLNEQEKEQLHGLLRRLMGAFPVDMCEAARRNKIKTHADEDG